MSDFSSRRIADNIFDSIQFSILQSEWDTYKSSLLPNSFSPIP